VETTTLSSDVLLHEQTHLDLTELYARKMRLVFDASGPDATLMLNFIYNKYIKEFSAAQEAFDLETSHGTHKVA
jgi:hypothetical protein